MKVPVSFNTNDYNKTSFGVNKNEKEIKKDLGETVTVTATAPKATGEVTPTATFTTSFGINKEQSEELRNLMAGKVAACPNEFVMDGDVHRYNLQGVEDGEKSDLFYILKPYGLYFGDWHSYNSEDKENKFVTFSFARPMTAQEIKEIQEEDERKKRERVKKAREYMSKCSALTEMTDYMKAKHFEELPKEVCLFVNADGDSIMPFINKNFKTTGYERIYFNQHEGRFCKQSQGIKKGSFFPIGWTREELRETSNNARAFFNERVYLCEGLATGWSVFLASGRKVIVTSGKGGLKEVGSYFPNAEIVADYDIPKNGKMYGAGEKSARDAMIPYILMKDGFGSDAMDADDYRQKYGVSKLGEFLRDCKNYHRDHIDELRDEYTEEYGSDTLVQDFMARFRGRMGIPCISTGFNNLDEVLGGGLQPKRLFILGGSSGFGKSSFIMNLGLNIAEHGQDVLLFSMEMPKDEILSRAISRKSYERNVFKKKPNELMSDNFLKSMNAGEQEEILNCIKELNGTMKHVFILDSFCDLNAASIRMQVEKHIEKMRTRPIVIVDYLQRLAPLNEKYNEIKALAENAYRLKMMADDLDLPVIMVSSLNRASNRTSYTDDSFSGSSGIEYASDVLACLQFRDIDKICEDSSKTDKNGKLKSSVFEALKRKPIKQLELAILKNRQNGFDAGTPYFDFIGGYSTFIDKGLSTDEATEKKTKEEAKEKEIATETRDKLEADMGYICDCWNYKGLFEMDGMTEKELIEALVNSNVYYSQKLTDEGKAKKAKNDIKYGFIANLVTKHHLKIQDKKYYLESEEMKKMYGMREHSHLKISDDEYLEKFYLFFGEYMEVNKYFEIELDSRISKFVSVGAFDIFNHAKKQQDITQMTSNNYKITPDSKLDKAMKEVLRATGKLI